jgi:16S rRNA (cytosine1402-N4)-methyltransferase
MAHKSVLLNECIESLLLHEGMTVLDATFGAGGHSRRIAEGIGSNGHLIALDADASVFSEAKLQELGRLTRMTHVAENFRNIGETLKRLDISSVDAALFDLGLSSTQLEESGRGFSFQRMEPLEMTFKHKPEEGDTTAAEIVTHWSQETIATILKGFGEERFARSIAKGIVAQRKVHPITTTGELVEVIRVSTPGWYHRGRTHFATQTFQALRMAVNDELGAIESGIRGVFEHMAEGGRIAVISFHSIEDRAVKQLFRSMKEEGVVNFVTKKPIIPNAAELKENPRARSAKLRVVEKI